MRVAFVGTVEGSARALHALVGADLAPDLVITLPLSSASRHSDFFDLGPIADAGGCTLLRENNVNGSAVLDALRDLRVDLVLVIGWSQICHEAFRAIPRIGTIGFHPAPLPRMRGRAVIPWTILLGERTTAASLFWIDEGVDSGPILMQSEIPVAHDETAATLYRKQIDALARMLPDAVRSVVSGSAPRRAQDHSHATYCARRTPADSAIDWCQPADSVLRLIRAVGMPYEGAFTHSAGRRLVIHEARACETSHRFIGLPGQVQALTETGFVVRCGDGECVDVTVWQHEDPGARPRLHAKLGEAL
ncbi:methionyl-tRNA formyltransferase [Pararhizobium mangrovi]|uniref:Methionyl-tRNA formyltransferase n=1 Tax=Pararhizobium mangrovi TaxID=2590452 RepID=A0A506U7F7_9HYPH|nr:methionyl-tRNA formyltransferase [Pararhizobium mangrovi]TPW29014.1 methionyl-tRNA formyltransferase [Pararhizobium mangrovi]